MLESPESWPLMKVVVVVLFVILALLTSSFGQYSNQGLILEGTIVSATPEFQPEFSDRRVAVTEKLAVKLQLYLRFKNEGTVPLLVVEPVRCLCDKSIEFFASVPYTVDGETPVLRLMQNDEGWRSPRQRYVDFDPFSAYLRSLDEPRPANGFVLVIEPGRSHEFRDTITIEDGYRLEWRAGKTKRDVLTETLIPDFPAFRVEYRLSVKGRPDQVSLFLNLQNRWKPFGHFVIAGEEEILLRSHPIINIPGK